MFDIKAVLLFILLIAMPVSGCNDSKAVDSGPVIGQVNETVIHEQDFRSQLCSMQYYNDVKAISFEERKNLLLQQIEKELLVGEAMKLGLHKQAEFREKIQNFWEQSLIMLLIQKENERLKQQLFVTQEEVDRRYHELLEQDNRLPGLDEMRETITTEILEEKKAAALEDYLANLKAAAKIEINEDNLRNMN